jgi:tetrahydromethanopterin S-methyltransferase subunit H
MNQKWGQPVAVGIPNVAREWNESNKGNKEKKKKRSDVKRKKEMKN